VAERSGDTAFARTKAACRFASRRSPRRFAQYEKQNFEDKKAARISPGGLVIF
jgi:hypothetical protein